MQRSRIAGAGLITAGVAVNNYAFLHGPASGGPEGVVVLDSIRYIIAAGGVILVAIGLFLLLRWAQSTNRPQEG